MMTTNSAMENKTNNFKNSFMSNTVNDGIKKLGLYLHIPFCAKKCNYCDFLSFEVEDIGQANSEVATKERYVQALINEIKYFGGVCDDRFIVDSIFIGGGTPSILDKELMKGILSAIFAVFLVEEGAEVTIETNPGTLTLEKLEAYKDCGINRLSMGVQSLDDEMLKNLGRIHSAEEFIDNFRKARQVGFDNINVDLMFAIPKHTMEIWSETLKAVLELEPEHISFYSLQLEEGTEFFKRFEEGQLLEIPDYIDREMYGKAIVELKAKGYVQYEISNAAKSGFECRHNLKYWQMEDYLGLGLGAHSYIDGTRFSNTEDMNEYIKALNEYSHKNNRPNWVKWNHKNSFEDEVSEFIFTGMRKLEGISLAEFEGRFGKSIFNISAEYKEALEQYIGSGHIVMSEDKIRFSLVGINISNTVLAEFV